MRVRETDGICFRKQLGALAVGNVGSLRPKQDAEGIRAARARETSMRSLFTGRVFMHIWISSVKRDQRRAAAGSKSGWLADASHAAFRGSSLAQYFVGETMNDQGDFAGASRWLEFAASDGTADNENQFAWFLATCPIASFRDPAKALSLALRQCGKLRSRPRRHTLRAHQSSKRRRIQHAGRRYAASGDFPGAIQTQGKVLSMLRNRPATIAEAKAKLTALRKGIQTLKKAVARLGESRNPKELVASETS